MKRLLGFFVCLALGMALPAAPSLADRFAAANRLYEAENFVEAKELYEGIADQTTDWKVHLNLGHCCFRLHDFIAAKYHYLKARELRPDEPAIAESVAAVNRHFRDRLQPEKPDFLSRTAQRLEAVIPTNVVTILLLAAAWILNLFLFLLLAKGYRKRLIYGIATALLLTLLLAGYHQQRAERLQGGRVAMVKAEEVTLYSGPGFGQAALFRVHAGLELRIVERRRDWLQVAASSQVAGWIEADKLMLI